MALGLRRMSRALVARPLEEAGGLMAQQRVRRLAVVDDDRELVGVLSLRDLARRTDAEGAAALAEVLRAISEPITTAKMPAREDPTGGRWRGSPAGMLHVHARRPCIRRMPTAAAR
jgi:hypothetical protein